MACKGNEKQTDEFFMLLRHPLFCTNVLKVSAGTGNMIYTTFESGVLLCN